MSKENKYYIPKLDQVFFGYQYEYSVHGEWVPTKIDSSSSLKYFIEYLNTNRVRVKCLDTEDILNLGFTPGDILYTKSNEKDVTVFLGKGNINLRLIIKDSIPIVDFIYRDPIKEYDTTDIVMLQNTFDRFHLTFVCPSVNELRIMLTLLSYRNIPNLPIIENGN